MVNFHSSHVWEKRKGIDCMKLSTVKLIYKWFESFKMDDILSNDIFSNLTSTRAGTKCNVINTILCIISHMY